MRCRSYPVSEIDGEHYIVFVFKETVQVSLSARHANGRLASRVQFVFRDAYCALLLNVCLARGLLQRETKANFMLGVH